MRLRPRAAAFVCVWLGFAGAASAQDGGAIIDRDRLDRHAPGTTAIAPPPARRGHVETPVRSVSPFVLRGVLIDGSSLAPSTVDAAIAPLRGQSFDSASLFRIADAVAAAYARSNVALYTILVPDQDFAGGVVRLDVIEGHVSHVALGGDTSGDIDVARAYTGPLTREQPLRRSVMERSLLLLSDIPGLETQVQMAPAEDRGGVDMGLVLKQRRFEYGFGIDNNGSSVLGRTQVSASATANGLFRLGDQTSVTVASDIGFDRFSYLALAHRQPLGGDGAAVQARVSVLDTHPPNGVRGHARAAGAVFVYPALRSYRRNLTLSFGVDGLNSDDAFLGDVLATERTRVLRGAATFATTYGRDGFSAGATLSTGLNQVGARSTDPTVALDFTKLNAQINYVRGLSRFWTLRLASAGQTGGDHLPASERFILGGAPFGRAFASAEIAGDSGVGASAELARRFERGAISELYGFTDGGRVWMKSSAPGVRSANLASAGLGARLRLGAKSTLDLEAAKAIEEPVPGVSPRDWSLRFGLSAQF